MNDGLVIEYDDCHNMAYFSPLIEL